MILTLEVVGEQAANFGASGRKVFHAVGGTIGRLPDNDWVFPDPYVSGRHALIRYLSGRFFVEDTSTNGVFVNSPDNRLQKSQPHALKDGDLLYIDAYQITVSIETDAGAASENVDTLAMLKGKNPARPAAPAMSAKPAPIAAAPAPRPAPPKSIQKSQETVLLPEDEYTVGLGAAADDNKTEWFGIRNTPADDHKTEWMGAQKTPVDDHKTEWLASSHSAAADEQRTEWMGRKAPLDDPKTDRMGARKAPVIDDHKTEWLGARNAPAADDHKTEWMGARKVPPIDDNQTEWMSTPKSSHMSSHMPPHKSPQVDSPKKDKPAARSAPVVDDHKTQWFGVPNAPAGDDQKTEWFGARNAPAADDQKTEFFARVQDAPPPEPPATARPRIPPQRPVPDAPLPPAVVATPVVNTPSQAQPVSSAPPRPGVAKPAVDVPKPREQAAERAPQHSSAAAGDNTLFEDVLAAAGIVGVEPSPELAQTVGEILRVAVAGLMEVQRARERMKDELRVRATIFKAAHNNPLKFSANVEDAFHNLLLKHNPAYLDPTHAFEDAFHDVSDHHAAILAALRVAFESMLSQFDPGRMQEEFERHAKKGSILGVPVKPRYWELYRDKYSDMVRDADTSFRHLFGDRFAVEYEDQLERLKSQGRHREK